MDDALEKRLNELALRAGHSGRACYTRFLEPSALGMLHMAACRAGAEVALWGGYEGAERCVAAFHGAQAPGAGEWPIVALRLQWNVKFANPANKEGYQKYT